MKNQPEILTFILAGGEGQRLYPLSRNVAKPVVPFGGSHHLIDFTIANCVNSGFRQLRILTQYRCESMREYARHLDPEEKFVSCLCATGGKRYKGNADAVRQNLHEGGKVRSKYVLILSCDHVYRMDYRELLDFHVSHGQDVTMATVEYPARAAHQFGVAAMDHRGYVTRFDEKPLNPGVLPGKPSKCLVNMGIYLFNTEALIEALSGDAEGKSQNDFGRDILPELVKIGKVCGFNFSDRGTRLGTYWRDIGTVDAYYRASMDLLLNSWPDPCDLPIWPLCRPSRNGQTLTRMRTEESDVDSLVAGDAKIDPTAKVASSVFSSAVHVDRFATVENSILLPGARIGVGARVRRAIIDRDARIADGVEIGYDLSRDREFHTVTESGLVVVPARTIVAAMSTQPPLAAKAHAASGGGPINAGKLGGEVHYR